MNTTKSVYNRLFQEDKVELASERVELALLDEIKKLENTISSEAKKAYDNARKAEDLFQKTNKENKAIYDKLDKLKKDAYKQISDAHRTAKDLGITLPREFEDRYDVIFQLVNKVPVSNLGNIFPL